MAVGLCHIPNHISLTNDRYLYCVNSFNVLQLRHWNIGNVISAYNKHPGIVTDTEPILPSFPMIFTDLETNFILLMSLDLQFDIHVPNEFTRLIQYCFHNLPSRWRTMKSNLVNF